ncbi:hypothetical protein BGX21_003395 [Mortierella sp. AD011]|nr:hypothetical protein BGX20_005912 [Mortierella sp. AD010]KAF9400831.1 hypothetical protein BGX21_003395 [Mortierella sp. AD011]
MDAIQDLYKNYRSTESTWIQSLSQAEYGASASSPSIHDCSLHYGELGFLLAGLKPCVLIQLPSPDLTHSLYQHVLVSKWMQLASYKEQQQSQSLGLNCHLITKDVRSPEMSLQGCILVWSDRTVQSHPQSVRIQRGINLLCSPQTQKDPSETGSTGNEIIVKDINTQSISEQDLAVMLDLPGRLPESEKEIHQMIEVSYWHQGDVDVANGQNDKATTEESPTLLTAFAAQPDQVPSIQIHFKRYRDTVREIFGIQLKLHIQSMADLE